MPQTQKPSANAYMIMVFIVCAQDDDVFLLMIAIISSVTWCIDWACAYGVHVCA